MTSIYFEDQVKLEQRLKEGKLTQEDFERVRQIPYDTISRVISIKEHGAPAYDAKAIIDELSEAASKGIQLDIGHHDFMLGVFGKPTFKPVHRLVTALAYALKDENPAKVKKTRTDEVFLVGHEFFMTEKEAIAYQKEHDGAEYRFSNQKFVYVDLSNRNALRACHTRMWDAPSDFFGHVQTLNPKQEIVRDIFYWDVRSP